MTPDDLSRALAHPGRASIPYLDRYSPDRPLVLECFRPQGHNRDGKPHPATVDKQEPIF